MCIIKYEFFRRAVRQYAALRFPTITLGLLLHNKEIDDKCDLAKRLRWLCNTMQRLLENIYLLAARIWPYIVLYVTPLGYERYPCADCYEL